MSRVFVPERWQRIIDLVERQGQAKVEEIAQAMSISAATVRRDLQRIEQHGLLNRTRGGAVPAPQAPMAMTLAESRSINPSEKEAIGQTAAMLIRDGDTVLMDGGFTTLQVARHISAEHITVVTSSFDVAQILARRDDVRLVLLGGDMDSATGTTVGPLTEGNIRQFYADKAILGADAISLEAGLTSPNSRTAQNKTAMVSCAREVIVVADHSKLGRSALYRVADASVVATLVTDSKADPALIDGFRKLGVVVTVADEPKA